jgi:membrane protease YdiL (CAAX protease family)
MLMIQGAVLFSYGFLVAAATGKPMPDAETLAENGLVLSLATLASAPIVVGLCGLFAWLRHPPSLKEYLGLRLPPPRVIVRWAIYFVLFAAASDLLTVWMGRSIVPDFMVRAMETAVIPPLLWLAVVVGAPVSEEFFFRGFLFEGLRHSKLRAPGAVLLTSLVWTVIHQQYDMWQMMWIFTAGILLGIARVKTGSLILCILLHALMNLIATIEAVIYVISR